MSKALIALIIIAAISIYLISDYLVVKYNNMLIEQQEQQQKDFKVKLALSILKQQIQSGAVFNH